MAYRDPQRAKEAVRAWRQANPDKVRQQRRAAMLKRAVGKRRFPRLSSITQHKLSDDEVLCIIHAVMGGQDEAEMVRMIDVSCAFSESVRPIE